MTAPPLTPETVRTTNESRSRLLTAEQLAERWQCSKHAVYRQAREGRIPTIWLGRYPRFRQDSIDAWEREQEAASNG